MSAALEEHKPAVGHALDDVRAGFVGKDARVLAGGHEHGHIDAGQNVAPIVLEVVDLQPQCCVDGSLQDLIDHLVGFALGQRIEHHLAHELSDRGARAAHEAVEELVGDRPVAKAQLPSVGV